MCTYNMFYYVAKYVFVIQLVNLQSVTSYANQALKTKCSFHSSKSHYI